MIDSQEIIERSIYSSILKTLVDEGYTVDPHNYDANYDASLDQFKADMEQIILDKKYFISLFGVGNSQSRGEKTVPRIVINGRGFMPGDIGFERWALERSGDRFLISEFPFESINQFIDIHLVANTQESLRMMTYFIQISLPTRGYIKPYIYDQAPFDGNIYIQLANFYDLPRLDKGVMEKVYQYEIKDTLIDHHKCPVIEPIVPITDISLLLDLMDGQEPKELIRKQS